MAAMLVSSRLLVSPEEAAGSAILEKRYFRFGALSYWAAIWFGYLEVRSILPKAALPRLPELPRSIQEPRRTELTQLLEFLVNGDYRDRLCLWNSSDLQYVIQDVFRAVTEHQPESISLDSQELLSLCTMLKVNVIPYQSRVPFSGKSNAITLRIDENDESACLYYDYYGLESFYVTNCGHLHLKYHLYQKAAELSHQTTISEEDFSRNHIKCYCRENLSTEVFAIAFQDANCLDSRASDEILDAIYSDRYQGVTIAHSVREHLCQVCYLRESEENVQCKNRCEICQTCAIRNYLSGAYKWCPICSTTLYVSVLEDLKGRAVVMGLLPTEREEEQKKEIHIPSRSSNYGSGAQLHIDEKPINIQTKASRSGRGSDQRASPLPKSSNKIDPVPNSDMPTDVEPSVRGCDCQCKKLFCNCGTDGKKWAFKGELYCSKCIRKATILKLCPKCNMNYIPNVCGRCKAALTVGTKDPVSEIFAAICEKHGYLCQFCIYNEGKSWICGECNQQCDWFDYDVILIRTKIKLGCCILRNSALFERQHCGHIFHASREDCESQDSMCRLCNSPST